MTWKSNAVVSVSIDGGVTWNMLSDHNRQPLDISLERIEKSQRMVNGTMRRYSVAKKRKYELTWTKLPSRMNPTLNGKIGLGTVDGGWAGEDIENLYNTHDGPVLLQIRGGDDINKSSGDSSIEIVSTFITDFSKSVVYRGIVDMWDMSITFEEI